MTHLPRVQQPLKVQSPPPAHTQRKLVLIGAMPLCGSLGCRQLESRGGEPEGGAQSWLYPQDWSSCNLSASTCGEGSSESE